jgi:hypothetical protein
VDPDHPAITLRIHAPQELIDRHGNDVINPVITVDLDSDTLTYSPDSNEAPINLTIDADTIATCGTVLLWCLKLRLAQKLDVPSPAHATMELF